MLREVMKKIGVNGFSILQVLLLVLVAVIVATTGWYVVKNSKNKPVVSNSNDNSSNASIKKFAEYNIKVPGQANSMDCSSTNNVAYVLSPKNGKANNCDDRVNVIFISETDVSSYQKTCMTQAELKAIKQKKSRLLADLLRGYKRNLRSFESNRL